MCCQNIVPTGYLCMENGTEYRTNRSTYYFEFYTVPIVYQNSNIPNLKPRYNFSD